MPLWEVISLTIAVDTHVHTTFSADGTSTMADLCTKAIEKGFTHITFTDHVEHNQADEGYGIFHYDIYSQEIERVRRQYKNKIKILKGIEFSEPHCYPLALQALTGQQDLDVVIGGIHYIKDLGCHYFDPQYKEYQHIVQGYDNRRFFEEYYEELLQTVKLGGFDVLAHFDNPKRYVKESFVDMPVIDEIIGEMIHQDIALEINTSPYRKGFAETAPGIDILQKYVKAGGEKITIGSDAHQSGEIGADFGYALQLLENLPVTIGLFIRRQFVPIKMNQ